MTIYLHLYQDIEPSAENGADPVLGDFSDVKKKKKKKATFDLDELEPTEAKV